MRKTKPSNFCVCLGWRQVPQYLPKGYPSNQERQAYNYGTDGKHLPHSNKAGHWLRRNQLEPRDPIPTSRLVGWGLLST